MQTQSLHSTTDLHTDKEIINTATSDFIRLQNVGILPKKSDKFDINFFICKEDIWYKNCKSKRYAIFRENLNNREG